jgi:hypothetical protein
MRRRRRRHRRRNAWLVHSRAHRRAALRGRRHRHHNPRRRRHHRRGLRRFFNPAGVLASAPVRSITAAFSPTKLADAGLIVAGGVANAFLSAQIINLAPVDFLKTKPGYYLPGLVSAGLVGALGGMVLPRYAPQLFTGSMVQVVLKAVNDYLPSVKMLGDFFTAGTRIRPLGGMGDFMSARSPIQSMMAGIGAEAMQEAVYGSDGLFD